MKQPRLYFLSGPVQSGKTTRLTRWVTSRKNIDGILAFDKEGKRYLKQIASGETKCLQLPAVQGEKDGVWNIGAYTFSVAVFLWAQQILLRCGRQNLEWLVIDEAGLLELDGRGLEPALTTILNPTTDNAPANIVLVVRESLVEKMIAHFKLSENPRNFTFPE